jgi:ketosteroid isomerase-like protein
MSEESTTPDLVELVRSSFESLSRGDVPAILTLLAPDVVFQGRAEGVTGRIDGAAAFCEFWEGWYGTFKELKIAPEEILDLGSGIVWTVYRQEGRVAGTSGLVAEQYSIVFEIVDGVAVRLTNYTDIPEARAAAERLAEERAQADAEGSHDS